MRMTDSPRRRMGRLALVGLVAGFGALACDDEIAPPFTIDGTGAVEGLVFFDADRNAAFDPSAGDAAAADVTVLMRVRGTTQTLSGGQAVTDADGRFRIAGLPAGSHDLFVDTLTAPAGVKFCQNPQPVTVAISLVRFVPVPGRQSCLIAILDAEAQSVNTFVTVQGLVTVAPGQHQSANAYIEDASGGVQLFGSALQGRGIAIGDRIEVSGNITLFNNEIEVAGALRVDDIVTGFAVPQPTAVTTAEAAAAGSPNTAPLQGRLIRLTRAQQASAFTSGGSRNAQFNDGSGVTEVRIESGLIANSADVATTLPYDAASPRCYDVTGVLGSFNGTAQVKPRTLADMQEVACTL